MFKSAAARLAMSYLMVIMGLSIGFSIIIYRVSRSELDRSLRQPGFTTRTPDSFVNPEFEGFRLERLQETSNTLRNNLIILNLGVFVFGGGLSYYLARLTLQPIEEALEAQSRFTADASHELRTPLTAMKTEIEVALRDPKLSKDEAIELLNSNLEEVGKLESLSTSLLRLARQNADGLDIKPTTVNKLATEAIARVQKTAAAKNITLQNKTSSIKAIADKESLIEVLVILLDNAVKYSKPDTKVTIASEQQGHHVFINVSDQGQGIKASDLPHIFERFYRADSSRNKGTVSGYGLGLAIAQKIITLNKGTITAHSTPGEGSTFTIRLSNSSV